MKIPTLNPKFQIVIPTHNRPTLTDQKTWRSLPKELRQETLIITSTKRDMKLLRKALGHKHVYAIDDPSIDGIAKKRQWIVENVKAEYIVQLDDDLTFQHRCPKRMRELNDKGMWQMKKKFAGEKFIRTSEMTDKQKMKAWARMVDYVTSRGFVHGGFGPRMGNNTEKGEYRINGRVMQAMFHHRRTLLKRDIRFDAVRFREDFHVNLSLLKLGYPNFVNAQFIVNADPFGKNGGCSDERTIEASNKEAELLAKMHTPFVKVAERKYKGAANIPRKEVTCYWQKAYSSAKKKDRYVKSKN